MERASNSMSLRHLQQVSDGTLNYFCQLIKNARHSHSAKVKVAKVLFKIFDDSVSYIDFKLWLNSKFGLKDRG